MTSICDHSHLHPQWTLHHWGKASTGAITNLSFRVQKGLLHSEDHWNLSMDFAVRQCKGGNLCKVQPTVVQTRICLTLDTLEGIGNCSTARILSGSLLTPLAEITWPTTGSPLMVSVQKRLIAHRCSSKSRPNTITSSREIRHVCYCSPARTNSISLWNVLGALQRPNAITWSSKRLWQVMNTVFSRSVSSISTCQYPLRRSKVLNSFAPA